MSELRMILVTTLLLHTAVVVHGQGFMLGSMPYADGDTVLLSDIGDTQADPPGNEALICTTTQTGCCGVNANGISVPADRRGEFYYPNGTMVPTRNGAGSDGFFRGRGYQSISLQRKSSASMDPPTGQYRCDIPDRNGVSHNMTINIGIQCSSNICVDGATCMNSNTCMCPTGYTGNGRSGNGGTGCTDTNECSGNVCVSMATCVNTVGSFTCTCPTGYTGNGRSGNGGTGCTDINECASGADDCVEGATCVNTDGSFTCTCPTGYTGNGRSGNGGTGCTDNNECASGADDCVEGATCVDTDGSFTCTCPSGFTGDGRTSGSGCSDLDECEDPDTCGDGYVCVNTVGSFMCNDINECTSGSPDCVTNATCVNTDGSFTCTCQSGLTGNGRTGGSGCTDIDECTMPGSLVCARNADCQNTPPGSFTCTCRDGFTGDGTSQCTESPVQLMLQGNLLSNNSELFIGDIGNTSTGSAILCTTNKSPCCSTSPNRFGEWRYPNGSMVPNNATGYGFFRGRGDDQTICLNRRNNAQSPNGSFCCELPDNRDVTNRLCVNLVPVTIIPSGINTAGEEFQLTCTFIGSMDTTPAFLWTGPPNDSPLPSDTRMVSDVMSSGSTHISTLQFNPLQSSHEGNYTCRVVVDTDVEITSIHVNVQDSTLLTTTISSQTTNNGIAAIVAGVIVGLLVVVILSVVAVMVVVCIFKRKHSTRNRNKDTSFNMAPNTSYGPVKSSKEMVESEYEDMKTGNEVYEEIPPATVTFDLATNVAYGPIQNNDIIITSGTTLYDEVTTLAAATGESV